MSASVACAPAAAALRAPVRTNALRSRGRAAAPRRARAVQTRAFTFKDGKAIWRPGYNIFMVENGACYLWHEYTNTSLYESNRIVIGWVE